MKTSVKILLSILVALTVGLAGLALSRSSAEPPAPVGGPASSSSSGNRFEADDRPTVQVYGDSITVGDATNFVSATTGPRTWANYIGEHGLRFTGGYAEAGRTSSGILSQRQGTRADYVVYAVGTNDLLTGTDFGVYADNVRKFAAAEAGEGTEFVVIALGPNDDQPAEPVEVWNRKLEELAAEEGWRYVDPFDGMRDADNHWVEGYGSDHLHPNKEGAQRYAENLAEALLSEG